MHELIKAKATQHDDVKAALLSTGSRAIIDKGNIEEEFWGTGRHMKGNNMLGKLWMLVRSELSP